MTEIERIVGVIWGASSREELTSLLAKELCNSEVLERLEIEKVQASGVTLYAVGYLDEDMTTYGMVWGPSDDLGDCVSFHPDQVDAKGRPAHLLRLGDPVKKTNHEIIYSWDWDKDDWGPNNAG